MSKILVAQTLVWLREKSYDRGTQFAVVETPDLEATDPVQVDAGTGSLWERQKKALPPAPAEAKKGRG